MSDETDFVTVSRAAAPAAGERAVEICEHKGAGHPDTLTDGACEAAARALAREYERTYGRILHFNMDKGLLVAGRSRPRFGGGRILQRMKLIVCGRAARPDPHFDVPAIVTQAASEFLRATLRRAGPFIDVVCEVGEGSEDLKRVYGSSAVLANDTSFGVGYAPYSALERRVLELSERIRAPSFRERFPAAGDDFKIMGVRVHEAFTFTVALALIDRHIDSVQHYFSVIEEIRAHLSEPLGPECALRMNTLDDAKASSEAGLYLTVSGLSAEMGDDGQVGRGNRVNGLITPGRPMSLEATAGKNPLSHVGKVYNVLAHDMARAICEAMPEVLEAQVQIVSAIGSPLDRPQVLSIELRTANDLTPAIASGAKTVALRRLSQLSCLMTALARGDASVY